MPDSSVRDMAMRKRIAGIGWTALSGDMAMRKCIAGIGRTALSGDMAMRKHIHVAEICRTALSGTWL